MGNFFFYIKDMISNTEWGATVLNTNAGQFDQLGSTFQ